MTKRAYTVLWGIALTLAMTHSSLAKSTLVSLSVEPEWPTSTTPGNVLYYKVTAVRKGSGLLNVALSSSSVGFPAAASVQFSPGTLRFTGHSPASQTAIMTVVCATLTALDNSPFTVTGVAQRESITITNQVKPGLFTLGTGRAVLFIERQADGNFLLRGTGASGRTYTIEATSSLANPVWTPLGTATADGNGRFIFNEQSAGSTARFFRAVCPAP